MNKTIWRERIETILVVTIITALVWLYAEGESVRTYQESVRVKFVAGPGHNYRIAPSVHTDSQNAVDVRVTFRSSAGQHQEFRQKTSHHFISIPITKSGQQAVVIKEALLNNPPINQLGLNIQQTNPRTVSLKVQPITKISLPVHVQTLGLHLDKPATVSPEQVTLKLPSKYAKQVKAEHVIASLSALRQLNLSEGKHSRKVKVTLPYYLRWFNDEIKIEPDTVRVDFTISNKTKNITLRQIPIRVDTTMEVLAKYKISLPEGNYIFDDIKLLGPEDKINEIKNEQSLVWAEIRPSLNNIKLGTQKLKVYLHAPEGVKVISSLPKVKVKISKTISSQQ